MNYKNILNKSSYLLKNLNIKSAFLDSELLLSSSLKISREDLLLNLNHQKMHHKNFLQIFNL